MIITFEDAPFEERYVEGLLRQMDLPGGRKKVVYMFVCCMREHE